MPSCAEILKPRSRRSKLTLLESTFIVKKIHMQVTLVHFQLLLKCTPPPKIAKNSLKLSILGVQGRSRSSMLVYVESSSALLVMISSKFLCLSATVLCQMFKRFFNFCWDEELSVLKEASVKSDKLWKASGKPRNGLIFANRQSCHLQFRKRLRDCKKLETIQTTCTML